MQRKPSSGSQKKWDAVYGRDTVHMCWVEVWVGIVGERQGKGCQTASGSIYGLWGERVDQDAFRMR